MASSTKIPKFKTFPKLTLDSYLPQLKKMVDEGKLKISLTQMTSTELCLQVAKELGVVCIDPATKGYEYLDKLAQVGFDSMSYLNYGFVDPNRVVLPSWGDSIKEGEVYSCMVLMVYSTRELYITYAKDFPATVNTFVRDTVNFYKENINSWRRSELMANPQKLRPGSIVCVYMEELKEWHRAEIVVRISPIIYRVLLVDLGELHNVPRAAMLYLHETLVQRPKFAVKASFDKYYCVDRHPGDEGLRFDLMVCEEILDNVFDTPVFVKFIRKRKEYDEMIWIVSLLRCKDSDRTLLTDMIPIEQQAIQKVNVEGHFIKTPTNQ